MYSCVVVYSGSDRSYTYRIEILYLYHIFDFRPFDSLFIVSLTLVYLLHSFAIVDRL